MRWLVNLRLFVAALDAASARDAASCVGFVDSAPGRSVALPSYAAGQHAVPRTLAQSAADVVPGNRIKSCFSEFFCNEPGKACFLLFTFGYQTYI